jgi:catechol 2,3-dioxygenase-like lactoylglutathione lyase family enzyme
MDWKLELVAVPVSAVDRAKAFYVDKIGFNADHDRQVNENLRFVQLTPPGSALFDLHRHGIDANEARFNRGPADGSARHRGGA